MSRRALVIGAGLAGTSAAERLAARGWNIDVIDRAAAPGCGASGNRAGVLRPLPSVDNNRLARLTHAAFQHARAHFAALVAEGLPLRWKQTGVLHLARDDRHAVRQRRVVEVQQPPADELRCVERSEASQLAGWPVATGGWWFAGGGWVDPASVCRANLARHAQAIVTHYRVQVARVERREDSWRVYDGRGEIIAAAPVLVLANAVEVRTFGVAAHLPLRAARGQVSHLPSAGGSPPEIVVCRAGYVTPSVDGVRCAGATFAIDDDDSGVRQADHVENLARLALTLPGYAEHVKIEEVDGRTAFRPLSPDRLPMIGAVADAAAIAALAAAGSARRKLADLPRLPGLYVISGFGARGIVWSALAGELLACVVGAEPAPVDDDLAEAVDPARFLLRRRTAL